MTSFGELSRTSLAIFGNKVSLNTCFIILSVSCTGVELVSSGGVGCVQPWQPLLLLLLHPLVRVWGQLEQRREHLGLSATTAGPAASQESRGWQERHQPAARVYRVSSAGQPEQRPEQGQAGGRTGQQGAAAEQTQEGGSQLYLLFFTLLGV